MSAQSVSASQFSLADLIGIPFVDGGRDRLGMDCWGLAREVMRRYRYDVPDFIISCFDTEAIDGTYERERVRWMRVATPEPGDVVAMRLDPMFPELVQHVGVFVGNGKVIHTMKKRSSHLIRVDDPYWSRRVAGIYRWQG